jgi:hypothetical protein
MAQVWHRQREQLALDTGAEAKCWRASRYELKDIGGQTIIEAGSGAIWERFSPFDSYQPTGKVRALKSGPHLHFLRLKCLWERHQEGQFRLPHESLRQTEAWHKHLSKAKPIRDILKESEQFNRALILFAQEYGLLGAFEEDFLGTPVLPERKTLVAPEAVINKQGRLRRVDPATTGKELLFEVLEPTGCFPTGHLRPPDHTEHSAAYEMMALPSEIKFALRGLPLDRIGRSVKPDDLVPWEDIRKYFGPLLILDEEAPDGVSVLCRREPLPRWEASFRFFPSGVRSGDMKPNSDDYVFLNSYLEDVSPYALVGNGGNLERRWRYRSLLQAMHVMLFLDLTGGTIIKKCQSRGCPNYFRAGSQIKSKYCSTRCANRASTRKGRGQEP